MEPFAWSLGALLDPLGFWRTAASSVEFITGPFLADVSGCGGSGTDSFRGWARTGTSDPCLARADFFEGLLGNPPVESAFLVGEIDDLRDEIADAGD